MTQKLKLLGPYAPDHKGPYAWITGYPTKCVVHSVVDNVAFITVTGGSNPFICSVDYIRNAKEVPAPREFWINEYPDGGLTLFERFEAARDDVEGSENTRTIHVREVLSGEGE